MVLNSVTSTQQWIRQPEVKKKDGSSLSWPTLHTTPFFLPPEDPFPVLVRHNSTPLGRESHDGKANNDEGSPRLQPPAHIRMLVMH